MYSSDLPRAPLDRSPTLFSEMIREIQEHGVEEVSFFDAGTRGGEVIYSVVALPDDNLVVQAVGGKVPTGSGEVVLQHELRERASDILKDLGWKVPEQHGPCVYRLEEVSCDTDREIVARHLLTATMRSLYIDGECLVGFRLRLEGGEKDRPPVVSQASDFSSRCEEVV